jgi:hypothetical protein
MTQQSKARIGRCFHPLLVRISPLGQRASTTSTPQSNLRSCHPSASARQVGACRTYPSSRLGLCLVIYMFGLAGCLSNSLTSLQAPPAAGTTSIAAGQISQFQALATYTKSGRASSTKDVTSQVTWKSSSSCVATISTAGRATGVSADTVCITAKIEDQFGPVASTSDMAVPHRSLPPPRFLYRLP